MFSKETMRGLTEALDKSKPRVKASTIRSRLARGWSVEKATTTPVLRKNVDWKDPDAVRKYERDKKRNQRTRKRMKEDKQRKTYSTDFIRDLVS